MRPETIRDIVIDNVTFHTGRRPAHNESVNQHGLQKFHNIITEISRRLAISGNPVSEQVMLQSMQNGNGRESDNPILSRMLKNAASIPMMTVDQCTQRIIAAMEQTRIAEAAEKFL